MEKYLEKFNEMCDNIGTSYKKAIKAMCYQCSGYDYSEVRKCSTKDCPIYIVKQNRDNAPKRPAPANAFGSKSNDCDCDIDNEED